MSCVNECDCEELLDCDCDSPYFLGFLIELYKAKLEKTGST